MSDPEKASQSPTDQNRPVNTVAIVGAGMGGLMSALALQSHGIAVCLFERDDSPPENVDPVDSMQWLRRGVPQSLHPHFFMGRLRTLLEDRYPELAQQLLAAGVGENSHLDYVHPSVANRLRPSRIDSKLRSLNSRRTTFEMILRKYVCALPGVSLRDDIKIEALVTQRHGGTLSVEGLRIPGPDGTEDFLADAVIDASGRFSKLSKQLVEEGVAMEEDQRDSGIFYYTRHYKLKPGAGYPGTYGLPGAQFEDFIVGALPADNNTFTVTFQIYRDDTVIAKAIQDPHHFQRVCEAVAQIAPWVDTERAEATSGVYGFGNMDSYWRRTVIDNQPNVANLFFVGDSTLRSNPKYGRGCTWTSVAAHLAADVLASPVSPAERIRRYEKALEDEFRQDWLTMRGIDSATERAFEVAVGKVPAALSDRIKRGFQAHVMRAILSEPTLFRDMWAGYHGVTAMNAWTHKPANWGRLARAWLTQGNYAELYASQRDRPTRAMMQAANNMTNTVQ